MLRNVYVGMRHGLIQQGVEYFLANQSMRCVMRRHHRSEMSIDVCVTDDLLDAQKFSSMNVPAVLCGDFGARADVVKALREGAQACVSIWSSYKHLLLAIECACLRRQYLCPVLSEVMCSSFERCEFSNLTPRETEVIHWISMGYSSKQIGRKLGLSPNTVETHRRNIKQKIDAHKVAELTRFAITQNTNSNPH